MKCANCAGKKTSPATGNCKSCGRGTPNRQAKLCARCSTTQKKCSQCLADLSAGPNPGK